MVSLWANQPHDERPDYRPRVPQPNTHRNEQAALDDLHRCDRPNKPSQPHDRQSDQLENWQPNSLANEQVIPQGNGNMVCITVSSIELRTTANCAFTAGKRTRDLYRQPVKRLAQFLRCRKLQLLSQHKRYPQRNNYDYRECRRRASPLRRPQFEQRVNRLTESLRSSN